MSARRELFELDIPGDEEDLPPVPGEAPRRSTRMETLPPGTVIFSVEQLTLLAVFVLILVVVAFLVGSYVSGKVERPTTTSGPPEVRVVEAADDLLPDEHGEPPLPETYSESSLLDSQPPPQETSQRPVEPEGRYTLEVIRFYVEDRAVAVMTVERLQKYRYAPVFLETHGGEISVCVGRYPDRNDKKGLLWKDEIRNLRRGWRHCDFVPIRNP